MSVEAITWALHQQIKPSSAKFVLVAISNCADGRDFIAWPSVAYLVEATSQDRKTVQANLALLRKEGFIEDTGERRGSTKQVVVYRLNSTGNGPVNNSVKEAQKRNSTKNGTVPFLDGKGPNIPTKEAQYSPERGPKTDHGTVRNRNRTEKETSKGGAAAPDVCITDSKDKTPNPENPQADRSTTVGIRDLVAEGVDRQHAQDWLKVRKDKKQPLTSTAWDLIKAQANEAGITLADAVRIAAENSWAGFRAKWHKSMMTESGSAPAALSDLHWATTASGIEAKGAELGISQKPGEIFPAFKARVHAAAGTTAADRSRLLADHKVNA